jgi:hypothetical protein
MKKRPKSREETPKEGQRRQGYQRRRLKSPAQWPG